MNRTTERRVESPVALFCYPIDFSASIRSIPSVSQFRAHLTIRRQLSIMTKVVFFPKTTEETLCP